MRISYTLLSGLIFLVSYTVNAQSPSYLSVFGTVVEESTEEPMEFVDVVLLEAASSTLVHGTTTNGAGEFTFSNIAPGQYFLRFNFIGFETKDTAPFSVTGKGPGLDLGEFAIKVSRNLLDEVEVTAEKSTYSLSLDRKVYNVQKDIQSQTSTATEILQNIPSITVDVNGEISLRGASNITYFINGRPSALLRASGSAALQQIPASTIERIEVITNPSAKYRPDGIGGIINIVLKADSRKGWNGTLSGNIGNLSRQSANLTLNHGTEDINIFGSYGFRHANSPQTEQEVRINKNENGAPVYTSENNSIRETDEYSHVITTGANFQIGENNQLEREIAGLPTIVKPTTLFLIKTFMPFTPPLATLLTPSAF